MAESVTTNILKGGSQRVNNANHPLFMPVQYDGTCTTIHVMSNVHYVCYCYEYSYPDASTVQCTVQCTVHDLHNVLDQGLHNYSIDRASPIWLAATWCRFGETPILLPLVVKQLPLSHKLVHVPCTQHKVCLLQKTKQVFIEINVYVIISAVLI